MDIASILSLFIYNPQYTLYKNLINQISSSSCPDLMTFPISYIDFLRWNTTCCRIPKNKLSTLSQPAHAFNTVINYEVGCEYDEDVLKMANIYIEQIVLFNNVIRKFNKKSSDAYTVSNIYSMPYVFPAYPILFSQNCKTVEFGNLLPNLTQVPQWFFDEDNTIIREMINYLKSDDTAVMEMLGNLSLNNFEVFDNIDYESWYRTLVTNKNSKEYNTIEVYAEYTACSGLSKYGLSAMDLLYAEIALLKFAECNVFCEFNPIHNAAISKDLIADDILLKKGRGI